MAVTKTWSHESIVDSCLFQPVYIFSKKPVLAMGKCPLPSLDVGLRWLTERESNELQAIIIRSSSGYGHVIWWDTGRSFLELRGKTRVHASAGMVCRWEAWSYWSHLVTRDGRHENDSGKHRGESKTTAILSRLNGQMEGRLDPLGSVDQSLPEACALLRNVKESHWYITLSEDEFYIVKVTVYSVSCECYFHSVKENESQIPVSADSAFLLWQSPLCLYVIPTMKY